MKLIIDIPEEYYKAIMEIPDNQSSADMLIIKYGVPHETVTEFADRCSECGREKVIDKIRAEIEDLTYYCWEVHPRNVIDDVLEIIDKHKAESEEKE